MKENPQELELGVWTA